VKLLVLCQDPEGPVVRHRVRALLPHLAAEGFGDVRIEGVPKALLARRRLLLSAADFDLVLVVRKLFSGFDIAPLRIAARRLVFDFDDAVMLRDPFQLGAGGRSRTREARFAKMIVRADLVLAGNAFLVGRAQELGRERLPVKLAPTPIDTTRYRPGPRPDGPPRIGWIGSRSTRPYLREITAPLGRILAQRPDVRFSVMADAPPDLPFDVEFVPWSEEADVPFLQTLSVGVMPLSDDDWSRGKCGFKLLQYMACGVPAVASPVGANVPIADDGAAARLASGDDEWESALAALLEDASAAAELGAAGRAHVEQRYATDVLGPRYAYELGGCARDEHQ